MRSLLPAIITGIAATACAQQNPADQQPRAMDSLADLAAIGILILFLLVGGVCYYLLRERWRRQREAERISEAQFEAEIKSQFSSEFMQPGYFDRLRTPEPNWETPGSTDQIATTHQPVVAADHQPGAPASSGWQATLDRLKHAGMVETIEGYVEVNGDPQGAPIVLMRDRKRALIVPYFETDSFTERNLQRFDYLIYVSRSGKAAVVSPLEEMIAEHLTRLL